MPPLALELHEEAIDAGLPPNAHRMGESQETGVPANPPASVIRDVNLVTVDGRPIAYVYRMENAAFLLQADLRARGALAVLTDPDRQLPAGAVVEPMRGRNGKTIPASHLFLPQRPNANASRCTLRR